MELMVRNRNMIIPVIPLVTAAQARNRAKAYILVTANMHIYIASLIHTPSPIGMLIGHMAQKYLM